MTPRGFGALSWTRGRSDLELIRLIFAELLNFSARVIDVNDEVWLCDASAVSRPAVECRFAEKASLTMRLTARCRRGSEYPVMATENGLAISN